MLLIVQTQVAPRAAAFLIFLVRLLGGLGERNLWFAGGPGLGEGCSSIQAIPAVAWEVSTWSTRSAASMNDVDPDEHWQSIGGRGTAPAGRGALPGRACCWS